MPRHLATKFCVSSGICPEE
uniref:ZmAO-1 n=1 Tax=Arundo donax TaxID=35708 RepID=A0A0A8ZI77_ARUDO